MVTVPASLRRVLRREEGVCFLDVLGLDETEPLEDESALDRDIGGAGRIRAVEEGFEGGEVEGA